MLKQYAAGERVDLLDDFPARTITETGLLKSFLNMDVDEEREKEREWGSNLWQQRLASPTAQVLVAQTTRPVQKNRLRDEL